MTWYFRVFSSCFHSEQKAFAQSEMTHAYTATYGLSSDPVSAYARIYSTMSQVSGVMSFSALQKLTCVPKTKMLKSDGTQSIVQ